MTPWSRQNGGLRLPAPRIGIVSSRHRLCAASRRPLHEASALLAAQVAAASDSGVEFFQVREPDLDGGALLVLVRALVRASRTPTLEKLQGEWIPLELISLPDARH